jgi:hypothetical protein
MKTLLRGVLALACALVTANPAVAQSLAGTSIKAPAGFLPGFASYCDDGTGHAVLCTASGSTVALVVSGDQSYTAGTSQALTMTPTGRLRVGLSSAATIGQTAATIGDLVAAVDPSGNQDSLRTDANHDVFVANKASIFWNGATGAGSALTGSATFTGASRDSGYAAATYHQFGYFNAFYLTDQAGTAFIDCSNDNFATTNYVCATGSLTPGSPLILQVPVLTRYHRARVLNGATNETYLWVNSGYTGG